MIRLLLALLVLCLLLVALQDSPPVARGLRNFPPAVSAVLRDMRDRIMGQPPAPGLPLSPLRRPATGPAAAEFGRFVEEVEAHAREVWRTLGTRPSVPPEKPEPPLPAR